MKNWKIIDKIAEDLGATSEQRRKWRERGRVSWPWRVKIAEASLSYGVPLKFTDFEDPPKAA